jgi:K+-transporting ATPase ATPase C chain
MRPHLSPGLRINLFLTLVLGIAYPLLITGVCQVAFPHQANGSLVTVQGKPIGSALICQNFSKPEHFQPRPSAAGNDGYDPTASGGSNYGPTNQKLIDRVKAAEEKFRRENPSFKGLIPADLLTASASGLDPDISPASAQAQAPRIAQARGVTLERVTELIAQNIKQPGLGLLGEPRVNVLALNLALDRAFPKR